MVSHDDVVVCVRPIGPVNSHAPAMTTTRFRVELRIAAGQIASGVIVVCLRLRVFIWTVGIISVGRVCIVVSVTCIIFNSIVSFVHCFPPVSVQVTYVIVITART